MDVYFCDPASPWQRGTNENTNDLLRQHFPKENAARGLHSSTVELGSREAEHKAKKTLGFITPADKLDQVLQ
ncbi:MAG: IS30 family transposase [Litorivivens sp.]|jgi:IS30 family transposase